LAAITIHLPAEVEASVKRASAEAGVSVSAWLSEAARRRLAELPPPPEVVDLFGAFPDLELPTRNEKWSRDE
jgi:hypothetical protein